MNNALHRHKNKFLAGLLGLTVIGGGSAIALNTTQGRMSVDNDAVKLFNKQVDNQVVDYYSAVCDVMNEAQSLNKTYLNAVVDSVGKDARHTVGTYKDSLTKTNRKLEDLTRHAQGINDRAPRHVLRPDDGNENANFHGALDPTITAMDTTHHKLNDIDHTTPWKQYIDNADKHPNVISDATNDVTKALSTITQTLPQVTEKAPILSEATHQHVQKLPECGELFAFSDLDKNTVLKDIVSARTIIRDNHNTWTHNIEVKTKAVQDLGDNPDPATFHKAVTELLTSITDTAKANKLTCSKWSITAQSGTPEYNAAKDMESLINQCQDTYDNIHLWASEKNAKLSAIPPTDVAGLNAQLKGFSDDLRQQHIAEAKFVAQTYIDTPTPNEATAKAIHDLDKKKEKKK